MKERREISSTRELINILDNAEINAKTVLAVKDEVGYHDNNYPDDEGNTISLPGFIHNLVESYKKRAQDAEAELKDITADYVKSQCDKTHVMVERTTLTQMANKCQDAYDSADSVEYDADECKSYADSVSSSIDNTKEEVEYIQSDLELLAERDMPKEEEK